MHATWIPWLILQVPPVPEPFIPAGVKARMPGVGGRGNSPCSHSFGAKQLGKLPFGRGRP